MPDTRTEGQPATAEAAQVAMLPLSAIRTSPFNYRKTHAGIAELAASIREHGVQQPVKVRPVASGSEDGIAYELVFGERRYRASVEAQRTEIPAIVEDLTDEQVQELQLLENTQRTDVHPLEEAEGFERMLQVAGPQGPVYTVAALGRLVGRSEQYVYGRLQLTRLVPKARTAFYDGKLVATTALLLARVPAALQEKALAEISEPRFHGEPMPARLVSELLQQRYMTRLSGAPFAAHDADLMPAAGPCATCPKRTGNAKALFADVEQDDVCTDPTCFRSKVDASWQRAVADARELGRTVLSDKEGEKVFLGGNLAYCSSFIDLDERCPADPKNRTWRRLLKKADAAVTIGRDAHGRPHELVARADALAALKNLGIVTPSGGRANAAGTAPRSEDARLAAAKAREDGALHRAIAAAAVDKIVQRVSRKGASREDLALWLECVLRGSWSDTVRDVCKRRGIAYDKQSMPSAALAAAAEKMTAAELQALALELGLSRGLYAFYEGAANTFGDVFKRACELHGVDLAELRKTARSTRSARRRRASTTGGRRCACARAQLEAIWSAEGLSADDLPEVPTPEKALRSAIRECQVGRHDYLLRLGKQDDGEVVYAVVLETRDGSGNVHHAQEARITLDRAAPGGLGASGAPRRLPRAGRRSRPRRRRASSSARRSSGTRPRPTSRR